MVNFLFKKSNLLSESKDFFLKSISFRLEFHSYLLPVSVSVFVVYFH